MVVNMHLLSSCRIPPPPLSCRAGFVILIIIIIITISTALLTNYSYLQNQFAAHTEILEIDNFATLVLVVFAVWLSSDTYICCILSILLSFKRISLSGNTVCIARPYYSFGACRSFILSFNIIVKFLYAKFESISISSAQTFL